jgi:hypothetical protein
VLRSIEDPATGFVFNIPSGCHWDVVVEVPHREGHLQELADSALSQQEGFWLELPVLACLGTERAPTLDYDIDEETRLVCKYLRAFEDGSIDELYKATGGGGPKV